MGYGGTGEYDWLHLTLPTEEVYKGAVTEIVTEATVTTEGEYKDTPVEILLLSFMIQVSGSL